MYYIDTFCLVNMTNVTLVALVHHYPGRSHPKRRLLTPAREPEICNAGSPRTMQMAPPADLLCRPVNAPLPPATDAPVIPAFAGMTPLKTAVDMHG